MFKVEFDLQREQQVPLQCSLVSVKWNYHHANFFFFFLLLHTQKDAGQNLDCRDAVCGQPQIAPNSTLLLVKPNHSLQVITRGREKLAASQTRAV